MNHVGLRSTTMIAHCQFIGTHGKVLLERDIQGKVRFLGRNFKATYDFAEKAAKVARGNIFRTGEP